VFRLDSPSVARRSVLGLGLREDPPLDLSDDNVARTLAALTILSRQERVRLDDVDLAPADRVASALEAEGCTMCGVCVRACPNGALELVSADGVGVLRHRAAACRSDRACVRLCPEQALTIAAELTLLDVFDRPANVLARVATAACGRCGVLHPVSDGALCPTCRFRRSNPFSSRRMTNSDPAD
jgi:ferredoxin